MYILLRGCGADFAGAGADAPDSGFCFFRFFLLFGFGVISTSAAAAIADNVAEGEGGSVVKRPEGCDLGEPGGRPSAVLLVVRDISLDLLMK